LEPALRRRVLVESRKQRRSYSWIMREAFMHYLEALDAPGKTETA
jgi:hypothetical protein